MAEYETKLNNVNEEVDKGKKSTQESKESEDDKKVKLELRTGPKCSQEGLIKEPSPILTRKTQEVKVESSQRFSKIDSMLAKFKRNTFNQKAEELSQQKQSEEQNSQFNINDFTYSAGSKDVTIKCYEPSQSSGKGIVAKQTTMSGIQIIEYSQGGHEHDDQNRMANPTYEKVTQIDKQSLQQTAMNFMSRFEQVSSYIEKSKSIDTYDRDNLVNKDDPLSSILNSYHQRIDKQNARVISDKNKFEVNSELREFENAQRQQNLRHKVKLAENEESEDEDDQENQHKVLERLNEEAEEVRVANKDENELDEGVKIIEHLSELKKRVFKRDDEIIEIDLTEEEQKQDTFIALEIEEMHKWVQTRNEIKTRNESLAKTAQLEFENIETLLGGEGKNFEKESFANI